MDSVVCCGSRLLPPMSSKIILIPRRATNWFEFLGAKIRKKNVATKNNTRLYNLLTFIMRHNKYQNFVNKS